MTENAFESKAEHKVSAKLALNDLLIEQTDYQKPKVFNSEEAFVPFSSWRKDSGWRAEYHEAEAKLSQNYSLNLGLATGGDGFEVLIKDEPSVPRAPIIVPKDLEEQETSNEAIETEGEEASAFERESPPSLESEENSEAEFDLAEIYAQELEATKQALENKHQQEMLALRQELENQYAEILAEQLNSGLKHIKKVIGDELGKALYHLFADKIKEDVLRNFAQKLLQASLEAHLPLKLEGNAELLTALKALNLLEETSFQLVPTQEKEIRLYCEDHIISTQLQAILNELNELR